MVLIRVKGYGIAFAWLVAVCDAMICAVVSLRVWGARKLGDGIRGKDMGRISRSLAVLQRALALVRTLLLIGVLGLMLVAGYWVYDIWHEKTVYERYLHNLLSEERAAEVCILDQQRPADEPVRTTVRFQEFRQNGQPLSPLVVTLPGEEIYVDAFVTIFRSDAVKSGQAKSLYLFRRIFTEQMAPQLGFPLYRSEGSGDGIPPSYVRQDIDRTAQQRVWRHLWRLIEDAAYAETQRVRTTFGQAVYAKMQTGQCYSLTIQHNGGLLLYTHAP
jgi:hypothetical protein